jgi:type II secretory pathway pseudopilin PulG
MRNNKFFTLLEMIVTFALLSLLLGIAVRGYSFEKNNIDNRRSEGIINTIYIDQELRYKTFGRYIDSVDIITNKTGYILSPNGDKIVVTNDLANDGELSIVAISDDKIGIAYNYNDKCYGFVSEPKYKNKTFSIYKLDQITCSGNGVAN